MSHRRRRLFDSSGAPAGRPAPANQRQFAYLSCITWDSVVAGLGLFHTLAHAKQDGGRAERSWAERQRICRRQRHLPGPVDACQTGANQTLCVARMSWYCSLLLSFELHLGLFFFSLVIHSFPATAAPSSAPTGPDVCDAGTNLHFNSFFFLFLKNQIGFRSGVL